MSPADRRACVSNNWPLLVKVMSSQNECRKFVIIILCSGMAVVIGCCKYREARWYILNWVSRSLFILKAMVQVLNLSCLIFSFNFISFIICFVPTL